MHPSSLNPKTHACSASNSISCCSFFVARRTVITFTSMAYIGVSNAPSLSYLVWLGHDVAIRRHNM
jgi:hypothetical protein